MQTVKVEKRELLSTVRKNREAHRAIFLKACDGYRTQAVKALDEMLSEAKAGKRIRQYIGLVEPMDQTKEYDRAIRMLEMSVDDTIELTEEEFSQYILDDWSWKDQFSMTNSRYVG